MHLKGTYFMTDAEHFTTLQPLFQRYARWQCHALADDLVNAMWLGLCELRVRDRARWEELMRQTPTYILIHCKGHYAQPYLRKELRRAGYPLDRDDGDEPFRDPPAKVARPGTRMKPPLDAFKLTETEWSTHLYNLCAATNCNHPALEPLDVEAWLTTLPSEVAEAAALLLCGFYDEELGWRSRRAKAALRALWKEMGRDDDEPMGGPLLELLRPE
jgi:hypothetical protein